MQTILYHAKLYVERGDFRSALCAEDGIIRAVGTDAEILALARPGCRRIDCGGRTVVPGFNDSHMHLMQLAQTRYEAPISGVCSVDDLIARCREFLASHPERAEQGLHAIGWNQDNFPDGRLPDRHDLDRISTTVPVVLERVCGHIVSANTLATQRFADSPAFRHCLPGEVLRAPDGTLCGVFRGNACNLVKSQIPDFTRDQLLAMLRSAMDYAASVGLTSVQSNDVGTSTEDAGLAFSLLREIYAAGSAPIRYRHQVCFHDLASFRESLLRGEYSRRSQYDGYLTLGPLKLFQDGSLGARTAMLRGGYPGDPDNHGLEWTSREDLAAFCALASEHGVQVVTHAIGDEAISRVLDAYEAVIPAGQRNPLRHALIHCQITDRSLCRRIADLGVLVMAQPVFLDTDRTLAEALCGKALAETSYAFGSMLRSGVHLSYGTDCPVESCAPLWNLGAAVTRCGPDGIPAGGFVPAERVDVEAAVDAYTSESAYAEFQEHCKGRLKPGYYADLTVLDRDIFTIDPMQIRSASPVLTMTDGRIVYERTE